MLDFVKYTWNCNFQFIQRLVLIVRQTENTYFDSRNIGQMV